jgi:hypothetical protein
MRSVRQVCAITLCAAALLFASQANAQKPQVRSRVIGPVDETRNVKTSGNVHPLARTEYDQGALGDSQPMTRMLILLQRGDDQEASLRQLLEDQQTTESANYHKWLTPAQFGTQFGPSDADVQAVTDWLTRQGFQVAKVSAGRTTVEFSGTAGQVRTAFQTEIHQFSANGKNFIANVSEPSIPAALAPVVRGVVALHNYPKEAHVRHVGQYRRIKATGELKPLFTYGTPANYALAPADFATIYSVPAGADGTGQAIAVVGQSNINVQDIIDFRNLFGLPQNFSLANIIVNGPDPGIVAGDEGESDLDIEWAGAIAPNANILFVTSESTSSNPNQVSAGVDLSALFVIDNNLAPVMSESYGGCEFNNGTLGNAFYNQIWQQAAAQGITVAVSAGDNGSAGCDNPNTETAATGGLAVNGVASTPYNVAVGGTDFNPTTTTTQYWSATNTTTTQGSALSYIPEVTWNDSTCAANYPTACTMVDPTGGDLTAASGGPSNCAVLTSNGASCSANGGYTKPAFQTGSGFGSFLSASTNRVLPDVSFFASNGQNGVAVIVCQADSSPQNGATCSLGSTTDFSLVGGTSVSTPAFAAVIAMVNQKTGQRQGNANYVLYGLAANDTNYAGGKCNASNAATPPASTCVFNDVVVAANTNGVEWNNTVACVAAPNSNCSNSGTGFGVLVSGSTSAFVANAGYDAATGLGSINVTNLLKAWGTFSRTPTITTLTSQSTSPGISGQNFTFTVTVTPAPPTTSSETISLIANTANGQVAIGAGTNGQPFALATNGTVTATTNLLPPGTTSIVARYGGDATHTASTSNPPLPFVANGSNQASKTTINFVTFDSNNNPVLSASSPQTATYGSAYMLQIAVTSPTTSNKPCAPSGGTSTFPTPTFPCPTGKITLTDNNSPLNDFPKGPTSNATDTTTLNNVGIAEDQPIQLPAGSHSIVASYAGDPNYQASTSSAMAVTITPASTTTNVTTSMSTITAGATVQLTASIGTTSNGEAPCGITNGGTVAFTSNGTALSGTVAYAAIASTTTTPAACTATLTTAISSLYPPPTNQPKIPAIPLVLFALGLILFLALVRWVPENRRRAYAYAGLVAFALLAGVIAGCGGGGSSSGGGGGGGGSTRTIKATYSGDTNYSTSNGSTSIQIQ